MRTINCKKCREAIAKVAKEEYLSHEYDIFEGVARSTAIWAVCGLLTAMHRRGRTKQYIKQLYDEMCLTFSAGNLFGKEISMSDIMKSLSDEYGIDWNKFEFNIESREEFLHEMRKN